MGSDLCKALAHLDSCDLCWDVVFELRARNLLEASFAGGQQGGHASMKLESCR